MDGLGLAFFVAAGFTFGLTVGLIVAGVALLVLNWRLDI